MFVYGESMYILIYGVVHPSRLVAFLGCALGFGMPVGGLVSGVQEFCELHCRITYGISYPCLRFVLCGYV